MTLLRTLQLGQQRAGQVHPEPEGSSLEPDYTVENHVSLFLVRPHGKEAEDNLKEGCSSDSQWFGGALAVEPRYIEELAERLEGEGYVVVWQ